MVTLVLIYLYGNPSGNPSFNLFTCMVTLVLIYLYGNPSFNLPVW